MYGKHNVVRMFFIQYNENFYMQITLPNSELTKASTESLMTDFLLIDFMQKDIIAILMQKIKILAVEE